MGAAMREIHTDYTRLKPKSCRAQIVLDYDESMTKDEVIDLLGSATGKALREITQDFSARG